MISLSNAEMKAICKLQTDPMHNCSFDSIHSQLTDLFTVTPMALLVTLNTTPVRPW